MAVPAVSALGVSPARKDPAPRVDLDFPRRLRRSTAELDLWIPLGFLVFLVLACFVWPEVYSIPNPIRGNLAAPNVPPLTAHHLLGTDALGNDVFSRILYGGRVSLEVGIGSTVIGTIVGGGLGAFAALRGGAIEAIIMRILEVFLAFPSLVLAIVVATYLGPSEIHVIWAISFFTIPSHARIARANTLKIRGQTFMAAAKLSGTSDRRCLIRHVAPNIFPQLLTLGLLGVGIAIIVEAALSFLGLGVPPPGPSWGNMIAQGQQNLTTAPDLVIIPSAFLFATVLSLNLLGDALRVRWAVQ
jgi:peptide/nickel transport system permease protein